MKNIMFVCILSTLVCGCAATRVVTPCGTLYRISLFYNAEVPSLTVSNQNGVATLTGYSGKGDIESLKAIVEAAVSAAVKSVK